MQLIIDIPEKIYNYIKRLEWSEMEKREQEHLPIAVVCKAVKEATEAESCEDAISRKTVLDEMYKRKADGDAITAGFIKGLPSVTPAEKQEPCEDAISRRAVLDINEITLALKKSS